MRPASRLREQRRLSALHRHAILDTPNEAYFDRLTRLASRLTGAPVCLISLVDSERQFFKSAYGLPEGIKHIRETHLSDSFCKNVVRTEDIFQVDDSSSDARVEGNGAIEALGINAYLGAPIVDALGNVLGSACAIDHVPREWSEDDRQIMQDIACLAMSEFAHKESAKRALNIAAELEEQNEQLKNAVGILAHDLKNPLSTIVFSSAMLKEQSAEDSAKTPLLSMISESADRMNKQIEDTLNRSRDASLGKKRELSPVDLVALAKASLDCHASSFSQKQISARLEIQSQTHEFLAEETALGEVLDNLISNAIKFSEKGSEISLIITTHGFILRDQGPGFTEDDLKKIFKRFTLLSARATAGESSSGLGLSICKQLIEEMDGEIQCISNPGEPAAFKVSLHPHIP